MSEITVPALTEQQSLALKIFRNHCSVIGIGALLSAVGGWLILIVLGLEPATKTFGLALFLLAISYLLLMQIVMRSRTGLWWHFLNAHPDWFVVPVALVGLGLWSIVVGLFLSSQFVGLGLLIILVSNYVLQWRLRSWTQARAEIERARYGEHWIRLAQVSLRDMALFRIPHERA